MSWRQMVQYKMRRGKSWKLCLGNILKKRVPVTCLLALESAPCLSLFYCELQGSIPQVTLPCFFDYVFLDAFGQWQVLARCWRTEAGIKSEYPILFLFSQHLQQLPCSLSGFHVCDTTLAPGLSLPWVPLVLGVQAASCICWIWHLLAFSCLSF